MRCADGQLSPIASSGYACSAIADPSQRRRCRARWHRTSPAPARAGRRGNCACELSMQAASIPTRSCRPIIALKNLTNVAPAYAGNPILSAEQIEDVVAFLGTLRD